MKAPITTAQAMTHPAVAETINTLGKMCDELRATLEAQPVQPSAPKFLLGGTRFKLSINEDGMVNCFWNYHELDGRWVALVAAEDDCHLAAPAQPAPLTDAEIDQIVFDCGMCRTPRDIARALEAAIKGGAT